MATDSHKPRILVVFYSRTGNTRRAARAIARATDADVEEIEDRASRRGLLGYLKSAYEALKQGQPTIVLPRRDPSAYDIVLVGPNRPWAMRCAGPVRAYLTRFAGRLPALLRYAAVAGPRTFRSNGADRREAAARDTDFDSGDVGRAPAVLIGEFVDSLLALGRRCERATRGPQRSLRPARRAVRARTSGPKFGAEPQRAAGWVNPACCSGGTCGGARPPGYGVRTKVLLRSSLCALRCKPDMAVGSPVREGTPPCVARRAPGTVKVE